MVCQKERQIQKVSDVVKFQTKSFEIQLTVTVLKSVYCEKVLFKKISYFNFTTVGTRIATKFS